MKEKTKFKLNTKKYMKRSHKLNLEKKYRILKYSNY